MMPLDKKKAGWLRTSDEAPHRSIALSHASIHDRPGLWADDPEEPRSVLWVRDGDEGTLEGYAAGLPEPALNWLGTRAQGRPIRLLAPPSWLVAIRKLGDPVELGKVLTWVGLDRPPSRSSKVATRPLGLDDEAAFRAIAPSWALRGWGDFTGLIDRGVAVGVPMPGGFAAIAWTYESDTAHDKIGVATLARYQRLGLGRAVAASLAEPVIMDRMKRPVWVTTPANLGSIAIARSLGFAAPVEETVVRWTPQRV